MDKFFIKWLGIVVLVSMVLPFNFTALAQSEDPALSQYIVKFSDSDDLVRMKFRSEEEGDSLLMSLQLGREIEYIEPDWPVFATLIPSDPNYDQQWSMPHIGTEEAWDEASGQDVIVAVLDSGVDIDHEDLEDNIWINIDETAANGEDDDNNGYIDDYYGWDFIGSDNDPNPDVSEYETYVSTDQFSQWQSGVNHGTVVAGLIGAVGDNQTGIIGVSYQAQIMPIRILDSLGVGSTSNVAAGINYAVSMGADIINLSFTGNNTNQTLENALENAWENGVLVVASAGNSGKDLNDSPIYPACSDSSGDKLIIGVAGTDEDNQKASWSNYGSDCVDISAPGTDIYSTVVFEEAINFDNKYQDGWYGTSVSAPLVAGVAALVKGQYPQFTHEEIAEALINQANDIDAVNEGYEGQLGGLVNATASLGVEEVTEITKSLIVAGAGFTGGPQIRIFDKFGNLSSQFFAYAEDFRGGVNVAIADLNNDDQYEVIAGAGYGGGPQVRVFDLAGNLLDQFFAYAEDFRGGVNVTAGDVTGDGQVEIITGPGNTGGPQVRVFDAEGNLDESWFAYGENFRGGVYVATGDLNGDGTDEIVTGTGDGGGPQVRTFDHLGNPVFTPGWFAYGENFRGGVIVATGDLDGNGTDEIVTGTGVGGGPHVRTFDRYGEIKFTPGFFAYAENFRGGVLVSAGDIDGNGRDEIITGTGFGGGPHVRTFDRYGEIKFTPGFFAYAENFRGGVNVASSSRIETINYQYSLD